jgi:sulfite dehydrogenase
VFFNVPAERHLSKRLLFFLTGKITLGARLKKNVVYVAKTRGEIGDFVCPLYFHHDPRRPTDRSRWRRPSKARERLSRFVYHNLVSRTGFPDIDPDKHRLVIHGLVKQPLVFTLEALARYPMVSRINFVECGGNSAPLYNKDPVEANVQAIHGLVSCSEWTGVRLSTLLEETGILPEAKWLLAEGADGPSMNRSIPKAKALDDAMIALYQNGERIAPSNGYPMRLLVPGYEGNMNVKWLHRIKLVESPVMAINETMQYTYRVAGPKVWQFFFPMEVKSFITHPSPGLTLKQPGFYEISGLAYSGNGRIAKVMVSADGGKSWGEAALDAPVLSKALTRSGCPGDGMANPWFYKAAPGTKRAIFNRPVKRCSPSAAHLR